MRAAVLVVGSSLGLGLGLVGCSYDAPPPYNGNGPGPGPGADAAADAEPDGPLQPDGPLPDMAPSSNLRRKVITIDPDRVTGGDHQNFPVWVSITNDDDLKTDTEENGSDIHFTSSTGGPLPYQIQRFDRAAGRLQAWVRMNVSDNAATVFELRYGEAARAHAADAPTVFSNSFAAVWHLDDSLTNNTVAEARGQVMGTAMGGLGSGDQVAAQLGGGVDFDGNNDEIRFANPYSGGGSHTFSAWVTQRNGTNFDTVITLGDPQQNRSRWLHSRYLNGLSAGFYGNDLPGSVEVIEGQGWKLVHWTYNGVTRQSRVYVDGQQVDAREVGVGVNTQGNEGRLGWAPNSWGQGGNTNCALNGILDEVRLATTDRSAGWVATEFANQRTWPADQPFYAVGPEQTVP